MERLHAEPAVVQGQVTHARTASIAAGTAGDLGLFTAAVTLDFGPRVSVLRQGDSTQAVFLLLEGAVKLVRNEEARELIVSLRGPGALLGFLSPSPEQCYPFTIETLTQCRVRRLAAADLERLVHADPRAACRLFRELLVQAQADLDHATARGVLSVRCRLARVLLMLADAQPDCRGDARVVRLNLPIRHWELAQFVAVTPEHLSRVLKELASEAVVRRDKGWPVIDRQRLREIGRIDAHSRVSGKRFGVAGTPNGAKHRGALHA